MATFNSTDDKAHMNSSFMNITSNLDSLYIKLKYALCYEHSINITKWEYISTISMQYFFHTFEKHYFYTRAVILNNYYSNCRHIVSGAINSLD